MSSSATADVLKDIKNAQTEIADALGETKSTDKTSEARRTFAIRKGESTQTSRGYSFVKALGMLGGHLERENCRVECEVADMLKKHYDSFGFKKGLTNSVWLPLASELLTGDEQMASTIGAMTRAGAPSNLDAGEVLHLRQKMMSMGYTKALSWIDESVGGVFVPPPAFGELIDVLRNNEVLMAAGARVLPMPPQGRIVFPRQTSAMTAYHVGESTTITDSTPGTGDVTLQAKKLTILAKLPNELFHFSAIPIEQFVRDDMGKVTSLKMDKTLLEDAGSQTTPKGLINYAGINSYTSVGAAADANSGYAISPLDPYSIIATTEEQNAVFKAFIMRPLLYSTLVNRRGDAAVAGDKAGPFLFNIVRDQGLNQRVDRMSVGNLDGCPVYKTTQLSTTRTRGSGSTNNTYIIGGDFNDYLIAMGGAMEFQISTQGDTPFTQDQTWLKGVLYYDGAPRHEASFTLCDNLLTNT